MLGSDRSNGGVVGRGGGCRIAWPTARGVIAIVASRSASAATLTERFPMPVWSPSSEPSVRGGRPTPHTGSRDALLQREDEQSAAGRKVGHLGPERRIQAEDQRAQSARDRDVLFAIDGVADRPERTDRKSTRLNSSHANISYAVFCLKKKISYGVEASRTLEAPRLVHVTRGV